MLRLGCGAQDALGRPGRGTVVAVYARAAYLAAPGGLVALTCPSVPMGPLHARVGGGLERLRRGDALVVTPDVVQAGPVLLDRRGETTWRAPLPAPDELARGAELAVGLLEGAPSSSLPVPVPGELVAAGDLAAVAAVLGGAGPGLTPAGDDCLAGILLVARARWGGAAERLLVDAAASSPTNDVAAAFLRWAARGQSIEPVHAFLGRAASGDRDGARRALAALTGWGHSSGADLALGLRLGLVLLPPALPGGALHSHATPVQRAGAVSA
jgi:hypothetical protein